MAQTIKANNRTIRQGYKMDKIKELDEADKIIYRYTEYDVKKEAYFKYAIGHQDALIKVREWIEYYIHIGKPINIKDFDKQFKIIK